VKIRKAARPAQTAVPVCEPTIEGTCMRRPAFTMRTNTVPVTPVTPGAVAEKKRIRRVRLVERNAV